MDFRNYIENLFVENGYVKTNEGLMSYNDPKRIDFWWITDVFDFEKQLDLYKEILTKNEGDFLLDKNLSVLVINKVDDFSTQLSEKIVEIENDVYFFKKYCLCYTESSWKNLEEIIEKSENLSFHELALEMESFNALKNESNTGNFGAYMLLYSIAHKLPFLMLDVKPKAIGDCQYVGSEDDDAMLAEIESLLSDDDEKLMKNIKQLIEEEHED